jgi:hypothetical protein
MEEFGVEIVLASIALGVFGIASLAWLYFLIGLFLPDFNFQTEKRLRKLFRMPAVIILDYDSYIRRRNRNVMFWITFACVAVLSLMIVIIVLVGSE